MVKNRIIILLSLLGSLNCSHKGSSELRSMEFIEDFETGNISLSELKTNPFTRDFYHFQVFLKDYYFGYNTDRFESYVRAKSEINKLSPWYYVIQYIFDSQNGNLDSLKESTYLKHSRIRTEADEYVNNPYIEIYNHFSSIDIVCEPEKSYAEIEKGLTKYEDYSFYNCLKAMVLIGLNKDEAYQTVGKIKYDHISYLRSYYSYLAHINLNEDEVVCENALKTLIQKDSTGQLIIEYIYYKSVVKNSPEQCTSILFDSSNLKRNSEYYWSLGHYYVNLFEYDSAEEAFKKRFETSTNPEDLFDYLWVLGINEKYELIESYAFDKDLNDRLIWLDGYKIIVHLSNNENKNAYSLLNNADACKKESIKIVLDLFIYVFPEIEEFMEM
jgi:hypothetical protein